MIPFDFTYHRPSSIAEAVALFQTLDAQGKRPRYYSGGTEIITLGRLGQLVTRAVIDIKGIPECRAMQMHQGRLILGAALTLTEVSDSGLFPLLGKTADEIADRTARNKITLGGNICGEIIYREAVLPLLLADCAVVIAGPAGVRRASIHQAFAGRMRLYPGEFVVQVQIRPAYLARPFVSVKRRRSGHVGYPVVSLAALQKDGQVRVALSGVCTFPFRSRAVEAALNAPHVPVWERVEQALRLLPAPLLNDAEASAPYRAFVLRQTLTDAVEALERVDR